MKLWKITVFSLQDCLHPYPDADLYIPVCQNEHDIVVYTLVMSLSTLINYLISYFWIKRDIKLVKIHISDFKPLFSPFNSHVGLCQCQYALHFLDRLSLVKTGD